jgi:WhiB family redox-sensing transcriptional regulator
VTAGLGPERIITWPERAACRGRGNLFFATDQTSQRIALAVCRRCPVRPDCLADALATEAPERRYGIVGGLTPEQRTASRSGPAAGTSATG